MIPGCHHYGNVHLLPVDGTWVDASLAVVKMKEDSVEFSRVFNEGRPSRGVQREHTVRCAVGERSDHERTMAESS